MKPIRALISLTLLLLCLPLASAHAAPPPSYATAIQTTVYAYFNLRYALLSSNPTARLTDLASVVAPSPQAAAFLSAESNKLALQLAHAQNHGLTIASGSFNLTFDSIQITGLSALVHLREAHDVVYAVSLSPNGDSPVSSLRNLAHELHLELTPSGWLISSDSYTDPAWQAIRDSNLTPTELLRLSSLPAQPVAALCSLPPDPTSHPYNRFAAAAYAERYALTYNPAFHDFVNADCTNFVSQSIHAGSAPMVPGLWYWQPGSWSTSWTVVNALYTFIVPNYAASSGGPEGCLVSQPQAELGDVIQFSWDGGASWAHSVIVTEVRPSATTGLPVQYVCSHDNDYLNVPYTYFLNTTKRFIHIERVDGLAQHFLPCLYR